MVKKIEPNAANLLGRHFTVQIDNDPKHAAKANHSFLKIKIGFHQRLQLHERPRNNLQLKMAAVKASRNISTEQSADFVIDR